MNFDENHLAGIDAIMGVQSAKAALDFEAAMAKLQAITGADPQELEHLKTAVLHMAQAGAMPAVHVAEQLAAVLDQDDDSDHDAEITVTATIPHLPGRDDTRIRRGFPRAPAPPRPIPSG